MNINTEVLLGIVVNLISIAYFAGVHSQAQKNLKESINELKEHFKERFESLEKKQDKHNNLIERMVRVEDSTKSAHKRINAITGDGYNDNDRG